MFQLCVRINKRHRSLHTLKKTGHSCKCNLVVLVMVSCCSVDLLRFLLFWRFISLSLGSFRQCQSTKARPFSLKNEVNMHTAFVSALVWVCFPLSMARMYGVTITFNISTKDNTDHQSVPSPDRLGDEDH